MGHISPAGIRGAPVASTVVIEQLAPARADRGLRIILALRRTAHAALRIPGRVSRGHLRVDEVSLIAAGPGREALQPPRSKRVRRLGYRVWGGLAFGVV